MKKNPKIESVFGAVARADSDDLPGIFYITIKAKSTGRTSQRRVVGKNEEDAKRKLLKQVGNEWEITEVKRP